MIETYFIDIDKQENDSGSGSAYNGFSEPLSLGEIKDHLIITSTDDDNYLTALGSACRATVEQYCHISIVEKIITLATETVTKPEQNWNTRSRFYDPTGHNHPFIQNSYELPEGPVIGLISVTTEDPDGTVTTLVLDTDYKLSGKLFWKIAFVNNYTNNVLIYQTGYDPDKIPYNLKLAILTEIAFRYENRGDKSNRYASQNVGLCEAAEYLALPFKRLAWQ